MSEGRGKDKMRAMVLLEIAKSHYESFKLFFLQYLKENGNTEEHNKIKRRIFFLNRQISKLYNQVKGGDGDEK